MNNGEFKSLTGSGSLVNALIKTSTPISNLAHNGIIGLVSAPVFLIKLCV